MATVRMSGRSSLPEEICDVKINALVFTCSGREFNQVVLLSIHSHQRLFFFVISWIPLLKPCSFRWDTYFFMASIVDDNGLRVR